MKKKRGQEREPEEGQDEEEGKSIKSIVMLLAPEGVKRLLLYGDYPPFLSIFFCSSDIL